MKKLIKIQLYSILLFLLSPLSIFAAVLNPEEPPEDIPSAPIGDYLWILMIIGIIFIYYKLKSKQKVTM